MKISKNRRSFPELSTKTLAGNNLIFPRSIKGKKAFIAVVFEERGAYQVQQNEASAWDPFYESELQPKGVSYYEIPMMAAGNVLARGWIDSGMRSGIDPSKHNNVACFYGNKKSATKAMGVSNMGTAHLFLIDEEGGILAQTSGRPDEEKKREFLAVLD